MLKYLFVNCNIIVEQYYLKILELKNKNIQNNFIKIILSILDKKLYFELLWFIIFFSSVLLNVVTFYKKTNYKKFINISLNRSDSKVILNPKKFLYLNFLYFSRPYFILIVLNLPNIWNTLTILRSPFVYKTTREQYGIIYKKLIINVCIFFDSIWSIVFFNINNISLLNNLKYYKRYIFIKNTVVFK